MTYLVRGLPIQANGRVGQVDANAVTADLQIALQLGVVGVSAGIFIERASTKALVSTGAAGDGLSGFVRDNKGVLKTRNATALPAATYYHNGLPFDNRGALCIDTASPVAYVHSGIPFTTAGAVAAT